MVSTSNSKNSSWNSWKPMNILIITLSMHFPVLFECIFDILYLTTILSIGLKMIHNRGTNIQYSLFAFMCILLGLGDCFHLFPRMLSKITSPTPLLIAAVGYGNAVTAIGMTLFYILFIELIAYRYNKKLTVIRPVAYVLMIIRIIFVLLPENDWKHNTFNRNMSILRNAPFILIGIITVYLIIVCTKDDPHDPFKTLWVFVTLSFGCYIPVAIIHFGGPLDGLLMILKTIAYIAIVITGYRTLSTNSCKSD